VFLPTRDDRNAGIDHNRGPDPSPFDEAALSERYQQLLESLGSERMREIIMLRLEGCEVEEIAEQVNLSPRSVRRKISIARSRWSQLAHDDQDS
jgi:DNA-directed RNA polymerase specialized sigma24 family protein